MSGEYVGVGLEITEKNDHVVIVAPLDGSPAIRAGLRAGEQILKVNGRGVADLDIGQVVDLIVGPAGSIVVLSIFDPATSSTVEVPLRRAHIRIDNVSWQPVPGHPFCRPAGRGIRRGSREGSQKRAPADRSGEAEGDPPGPAEQPRRGACRSHRRCQPVPQRRRRAFGERRKGRHQPRCRAPAGACHGSSPGGADKRRHGQRRRDRCRRAPGCPKGFAPGGDDVRHGHGPGKLPAVRRLRASSLRSGSG